MIKKNRITLFALFTAASIITGCGIEAQESSFKDHIKELEELSQKVDGDLKKSIEAEKARIQVAYAKLPADVDARGDGLGELNSSSYKFISTIKEKLEKIGADKKSAEDTAEKAEFGKRLADLTGDWNGLGIHLLITPDGTVQYEKLDNGINTSLTGGKVVRITADSFEVKVLVASTTFKINSPPVKQGTVWTMKVDGVELKHE